MSSRTFNPVLDARTLASALGGRKSGGGFVVRCPAHEDNNPSLSIQEKHGKVLLHCFAGCSQDAVLDALRQRGLWTAEPQADIGKGSKLLDATGTGSPLPSIPQAVRSAQSLWERYSPVSPSHSYLTKKKIGTHGARAVSGQSALDRACRIG